MSTRSAGATAWFLLIGLACAAPVSAGCPPRGQTDASLQALKAAGFKVDDAARRNALALALADCLADPRPALRDGVAFEALSTWLRADGLEVATRRALRDTLVPRLRDTAEPGVAAPFAALALSELVRTDRIRPWMTRDERAAMVDAAATYLRGVRDYRGFDARDGWRHGVAHGADFALQLVLNPALDRTQLDRLLDAVAAQVAPQGHAYIHGESSRLARPVLHAALRGLHSAADWQAWFERVATPAPLASWQEAFASETGLVRRHNTAGFLAALYLLVQEQPDDAVRVRVLPGLRAALEKME